MHTRQAAVVALAALLAFAGAGPAVGAPESAENAPATEVSSCTVIQEPGRYVLTRVLAPTGGVEYESPQFGALKGCLVVAQHLGEGEFVLDGNGHTIGGANVGERTDDGRAVGAGVVADETRVTVTDLTVTGWEAGVRSWAVTTVDGVTAIGNGVGLSFTLAPRAVTNSVVSKNDGAGIVAAGGSPIGGATAFTLLIEGNVVEKNGGTGVGLGSIWDGRVADNDISKNDGTGLSVAESRNLTVTENRIAKNGGHGAEFSGQFFANEATVTRNLFEKNAESGVHVHGDLGVAIHENRFEKNGVGVSSTVFDRDAPRGPDVPPLPPYRQYVNATGNYWGDEDGPASAADPDAPFADPETGALACGDGDAVTESATPGVSAVRFDPYLAEAPPTAEDGDDRAA